MKNIKFTDYLKDYLEINKITNKEFANRIGITPKHLIDILDGKCDLTTNLIEAISIVTNISTDYIYRLELNYKFEKKIEEYLKKNNLTLTTYLQKFNYKYLSQNNWIDFIDSNDKFEMVKDILKFLRVNSPDSLDTIDNSIYYKSKNDKKELLLLWLEKCYRIVIKQNVSKYNNKNIIELVNYIKEMAFKNIFDADKLIKKFNENGIGLVIQEDIPGSKIRGAFKVHKDMPAIYITYKHNRIADIYFTLLHELAHCKRDFNKAKSTSLVLYHDLDFEEIADKEAFNWMVDDEYYNVIKNDGNYNVKNETKYPKSFVVYRLAHDKKIKYSSNDYQKYNPLLK